MTEMFSVTVTGIGKFIFRDGEKGVHVTADGVLMVGDILIREEP